MPGHQLAYAAVKRLVGADVTECQIFGQQFFREGRPDFRMTQERFDFRGKREDTIVVEVVERLDSQPVPRAKKRLSIVVPNRKRKHSAELLDAGRTILLVRVNNRLGVAPRDVLMSGR